MNKELDAEGKELKLRDVKYGEDDGVLVERVAADGSVSTEAKEEEDKPREKTLEKDGMYSCVQHSYEYDASDIFHIRPFEDQIKDVRLQDMSPWQDSMQSLHVLHLETVGKDVEELYDILCKEYQYGCGSDEDRDAQLRWLSATSDDNRH